MRSINRQLVVAGLAVLTAAFSAMSSFACPTYGCTPVYGYHYNTYCYPSYYQGSFPVAPVVQQGPAIIPNGGPIGVNPIPAVVAPVGPAALAPVAPIGPNVVNGQPLPQNIPQAAPIAPVGPPVQNLQQVAPFAPNGQPAPGAPVGVPR